MPTVDTNILLRWLLGDVPAQSAAADALFASSQRIQVPDLALLECVYVLERVMRLSRPTVVLAMETIMSVSDVAMNRAVWRAALDNYLTHPKLSVTDTVLAAQAQASGELPLLTFDRKLASQLAGAELLR